MAITGKVRETNDFNQKKVGIFIGKVIAINPNATEYKDKLGIELKEDSKAAEYVGESKDGNTTLRINVWLEGKNGFKQPITFFLEDKEKSNKDGSKRQYINQTGTTSWATDEESLPEWFKVGKYRVAYVGEEDFYNFVKNWLAKLDYRDPNTTVLEDWKKLLRGKLDDFKAQIGGTYDMPVGAMATIKTVQKDGENKEYQGVYNRAFIPEYAVKQLRLVDYNTEENQEKLKDKETRKEKLGAHERFVLSIIGTYGCKDFYKFCDLKDYDPTENIVATDEPMTEDAQTNDLPF